MVSEFVDVTPNSRYYIQLCSDGTFWVGGLLSKIQGTYTKKEGKLILGIIFHPKDIAPPIGEVYIERKLIIRGNTLVDPVTGERLARLFY